MLFKIEDESYDGNEAVDKSKGNVSKAEDTIEAAQKEISVRLFISFTTIFYVFKRNKP